MSKSIKLSKALVKLSQLILALARVSKHKNQSNRLSKQITLILCLLTSQQTLCPADLTIKTPSQNTLSYNSLCELDTEINDLSSDFQDCSSELSNSTQKSTLDEDKKEIIHNWISDSIRPDYVKAPWYIRYYTLLNEHLDKDWDWINIVY